MTNVVVLGSVCHEWNYQAHRCTQRIDVKETQDTGAAFFVSKLAVDADGAWLLARPQCAKWTVGKASPRSLPITSLTSLLETVISSHGRLRRRRSFLSMIGLALGLSGILCAGP